ncbi:response regulator [Streptomyces albus]|uniref:response regulator n=1 Tax=Streptomyces TaxID=1883 RepID=UPI0004CCA147|nr:MULTISPECIES: response regulator [Streptomyces]QID34908.1 response regulator [Streptomyces albus]
MEILVIEDNDRVSAALRAALSQQGLTAVCAGTGRAALELLEQTRPDAVLLDLGLPDYDGFALCSEIRASSSVPILVTSTRADHAACVRGLDLGADDFLVKPYNLAEVLARVRAVVRRWRAAEPELAALPDGGLVLAGPLRIDLDERVVLVNGAPIDLSDEEFGVLAALAHRPGEVLRADQLVDQVLRVQRSTLKASLHGCVASLAERLGVSDHVEVEAVDRAGYRLSVSGAAA